MAAAVVASCPAATSFTDEKREVPVAPPMQPNVLMITVLDDIQLASVGGGYSPELFAQMQKSISMGLTVNSTWTGQHGNSSAGWSHYNGRAFDSIGPDKTMWQFYNQSLGTNPHELIFHDKHIEDGHVLPKFPGHDTHIHYGK